MQTGAVDTMTGRGNMESTGQDMDLYIQGEGYFVVRKEATADSDAVTYYTRDGAFKRDSQGLLVNSNGYHVKGQPTKGNIPAAWDNNFKSENYFGNPNATGSNLADINIPETVNGQRFESVTIDNSGLVVAKYGDTRYAMGKIELAKFNNPSGLKNQAATTSPSRTTRAIRTLQLQVLVVQVLWNQDSWKCQTSIWPISSRK